jgi:hypothetical protein
VQVVDAAAVKLQAAEAAVVVQLQVGQLQLEQLQLQLELEPPMVHLLEEHPHLGGASSVSLAWLLISLLCWVGNNPRESASGSSSKPLWIVITGAFPQNRALHISTQQARTKFTKSIKETTEGKTLFNTWTTSEEHE